MLGSAYDEAVIRYQAQRSATTLKAHFDGKTIVLDEPVPLPLATGARVKISIEAVDDVPSSAPAPRRFQPLNIRIDPELSNAIALDPAFSIEES